jgi:hypothetical protein
VKHLLKSWSHGFFCLFLLAATAPSLAQNVNAGQALYNAILVSGNPNCASGGCHGPDPRDRQNKIQNGDTPGGIAFAISSVRTMSFLKGRLSSTELTDLAAYIANPAAATGTPSIAVSLTSITFPTTGLGVSSATTTVTVSNPGTAALTVSNVVSASADFVVSNSSCGVVAPAASCSFGVAFAPQAVGARIGSVTISHNATGATTVVSLSGSATQPSLSASTNSIDFGFVAGDAPSPIRTVTITNATITPITLTAVRSSTGSFVVFGGSCSVGVMLAPSSACSIDVKFDAQQAGIRNAELIIESNLAPPISVFLTGEWIVIPTGYKLVVEYRYAPLNYYFITSRPTEQQVLDGVAGFERTGERFFVYAADSTPPGARSALTRFYFDRIAIKESRGSHFYTLIDSERSFLRDQNPSNAPAPRLPFDEGADSFAILPIGEGAAARCAVGLLPVYRLFRGNTRFPDDPNHRFTVRSDIYNTFVANGWDGEGVRFCVPAN